MCIRDRKYLKMEMKRYFLGSVENNRIVKLIRIVFGIVCIAIALYWVVFNMKSVKADATLWITTVFLIGFGFYQIWSGLGRAIRYIEFGKDSLSLKKNSVMPPVLMTASDMERIEIFPLNVVFYFKSRKRILLRFGTTFYDQNEIILDEIIGFAETNNIPFEVIEEKI